MDLLLYKSNWGNVSDQVINKSVIKVQTNAVAQTINIGAASAGMYYANIINTKGGKTVIAFLVR